MWCAVKNMLNFILKNALWPIDGRKQLATQSLGITLPNSPFSCQSLIKVSELLSWRGSQVKRWPSLDPCEVWKMPSDSAAVVPQSLWTGRCLMFHRFLNFFCALHKLIAFDTMKINGNHMMHRITQLIRLLKILRNVEEFHTVHTNHCKSLQLQILVITRPATMISVPARAGRVGSRFLGTWGDLDIILWVPEMSRISWSLGSQKNVLKHDQKITKEYQGILNIFWIYQKWWNRWRCSGLFS